MTRAASVPARLALAAIVTVSVVVVPAAQGTRAAAAKQRPRTTRNTQTVDEEYTRRIKQHTQDPRIITELVDHLPASDTVPSPLKFFGRIVGEPGNLTYYKDIVRYLEALDKASDRVTMWKIGKSDEGRDMVAVAIADEATIKSLDKYKQITAQLTDPRKITEAQARRLVQSGKPIYYAMGSIHSPETGSPEMLMELAFRMAVEETPFIETIRNNAIFMFTPATEVDGRDKQVDNFYYQKKTGKPPPPLVYWGHYVAHDNNRDAMGVSLNLTRNMLATFLEWHPTVWHDLHESVTYLYTSTGTGPYNTSVDPIVVDEWWLLAKTETSEMAKRGVPGVWTYNFYDGWVPNYLFWIANMHNSIGRFYETQSYRGENYDLNVPVTTTSREWYRPNPPLPSIKWGPRNNVNMQQSALLIAMNHVARNKEQFLENYYFKNKRAIERGKAQAPYAWLIPAGQRRKVEAAGLVNLLRLQGAEVHTAGAAWASGNARVSPGDYIVRMDQPYGTLVDILLDTQFYAAANPRPYDDTGWSLPLLRNVRASKIDDKTILDQPMTLVAQGVVVPGTISGAGDAIVVEHTTDNTLATFRFRHAGVKMLAAEEDFEAGGRKLAAGAFIIPNADRAALEPSIKELGLTAYAVSGVPAVRTHELDVPRIGYVHSWARTQDEGWVRMAFDRFKVPYTYFADQKLREGNLRAKYDVIVLPHIGGDAQSQVNGLPTIGDPIPYKKSELTPNLGVQDSSDDIRGGMGLAGLANLAAFVQEGGTLLVEGSTSTIFPSYGLMQGVTIEEPTTLFARGTVLKAVFADKKSPIAYGYDQNALAVYFNQGPVIRAGIGGGGFGGFGGGGSQIPGVGQNLTPNAVPETLTTLEEQPQAGPGSSRTPQRPMADETAELRQLARAFGFTIDERTPRVVMRFPSDPNDMLLSGALVGGQALANRAVVLDAPVGKGHVVMFASRPYWRWETQGSFFLGFNAILNWNDLDAGKTTARRTTTSQR
jgi:hypothetical protein